MPFIRINNRNNFLLKEYPKVHPESLTYKRFWRLQKKRCIEGLWSIDNESIHVNLSESTDEITYENSWRWMPGNLFFYVNAGTILHQEEGAAKTAPKKKIKPLLRDVEWEFFYNWIEARGFSGFEDDNDYTCNRSVINHAYNSSIEIDKTCYKKDGSLKEYISARQYLRKLHKKQFGIPVYENEAQNLMMMGSRGFGKSFMVGVGVILYEILFDGAKRYDEESRKNPHKVEVFVGSASSDKSSDLLGKTKDGLLGLPGAWAENTDEFVPSPFFKQMTGELKPNNTKNPWRHEYQKKIGGQWVTKGTGSNVKHGIYTTENPEAAAGGRYAVIVVEEVGLTENIVTIHGSNTATQREGTIKFGSSLYLGTGGNIEKVQGSEILFRDPEGFEFLAFDDEWEGTGKIGWFVPAYYMYNQFKDKNGNTDVERAMRFIENERAKKRKSKDPSALSMEMMNYPIVPSEMFLNAKGAMFPQAELKAHLAYVKANPHKYQNAHHIGELIWNSKGELIWEDGNANELVLEFPLHDNKNKPGIIEIFEMPQRDAHGNVFKGRYIQGTDTYDDDESVTNSFGSTWILDLWTDRIVAEYFGRRLTKDFYEVTRKLNIYYNTVHNYENNKKGLYSFFEQKSSTHLLCDTPESLKDIADITISKIGNKSKGTHTSPPITAYGLRLILDWLLTPAYGEEEGSEVLNLHTIRSIGLLNELINYNKDGNFDRISALIMTMILREELYKFRNRKQEQKIKALSEDDFFSRNFNSKKVKFNIYGNGVTTSKSHNPQMLFDNLLKKK
jgi:hypothetical protein